VSEKGERPIIIVKRKRGDGGGHHGGAWKVAYADFVTAMMAFFMVMWLVASVNKEQRAAMFEYFKNPSMQDGKSVKASQGQMGPGGASTSVINMGGGLDAQKSTAEDGREIGKDAKHDGEEAVRIAAEAEKQKFQALMDELKKAIDESPTLSAFKDQLLLDITSEGLRIQIVDAQNRPMFDLGSSKMKDYTTVIIKELTSYLNSVPNRLSLSGHTDTTPYSRAGYSNWDLSADRANAARRALESGNLNPDKIARIVGLSSSVLFDKENPRNPINRRISIIVMTKQAEEAAVRIDEKNQPVAGAAAPAAGVVGGAVEPVAEEKVTQLNAAIAAISPPPVTRSAASAKH
jgi:chemotaxis protein MotB